MTNSDLEARLQLITKAAPDLRKAGVTALTIGDIVIGLSPADIEPDTSSNTTTPEHPDDPLKDPATFGGSVPRSRWEQPLADEDDDA